MTKSLLKVCCRLLELKPKAPGVYLLGEHPLGCRWKTALCRIATPKVNQKLNPPAISSVGQSVAGHAPGVARGHQGDPKLGLSNAAGPALPRRDDATGAGTAPAVGRAGFALLRGGRGAVWLQAAHL